MGKLVAYRRTENEMSSRLRGMLHRPVDIITDSGYAEWQARGSSMHPIGQRISLQNLRIARSSKGMHFLAPHGGNVRIVQGGGHGDSDGMGEANHSNHRWVITVIKNTNGHEWTRIFNHKTHKTHQNASPPDRQSAEGFV